MGAAYVRDHGPRTMTRGMTSTPSEPIKMVVNRTQLRGKPSMAHIIAPIPIPTPATSGRPAAWGKQHAASRSNEHAQKKKKKSRDEKKRREEEEEKKKKKKG